MERMIYSYILPQKAIIGNINSILPGAYKKAKLLKTKDSRNSSPVSLYPCVKREEICITSLFTHTLGNYQKIA
jgi:hypothetical protein